MSELLISSLAATMLMKCPAGAYILATTEPLPPICPQIRSSPGCQAHRRTQQWGSDKRRDEEVEIKKFKVHEPPVQLLLTKTAELGPPQPNQALLSEVSGMTPEFLKQQVVARPELIDTSFLFWLSDEQRAAAQQSDKRTHSLLQRLGGELTHCRLCHGACK